jgi:hypothetical protein
MLPRRTEPQTPKISLQMNSMVAGPIFSTELLTYNLTNNILTTHDNKLLVGGIFCDFTEGLNSVKHDTLLAKIWVL